MRTGLLQRTGRHGRQLQFSLEPVGEHLAAWHVYRQPKRTLAGRLKARITRARKEDCTTASGLFEAMGQVEAAVEC